MGKIDNLINAVENNNWGNTSDNLNLIREVLNKNIFYGNVKCKENEEIAEANERLMKNFENHLLMEACNE